MRDLEWYLDLKGTKTGPFAARDIVEMVRAAKVPDSIKVTADRLNGEWISARELIEAFSDLNATPKSPWAADFNPPPRPTEQLEVASHTHYSEEDQEYDPTASLFQAIRNLKARALPPKPARDRDSERASSSGEYAARSGDPFLSPQAILVSVLGVLIFGAAYMMWQLVKNNASPVTTKSRDEPTTLRSPTPPLPERKAPTGKLLSDGAGGGAPARTSAPMGLGSRLQTRNDAKVEPPSNGGAVYENELSPDTLAELQAAQEQDQRSDAAGSERTPAGRRRRGVSPPPVGASPEPDAQANSSDPAPENSDPDGGVAPDAN